MAATGQGQGSRRFARLFGLDPRIVFATFLVDDGLFAAEASSTHNLILYSLGAALIAGLLAFRIQRRWYGDDTDLARNKAIALGVLMAIPTPIPAVLYVPAGAIGFVEIMRRRTEARFGPR